jgi:hypothetical protein
MHDCIAQRRQELNSGRLLGRSRDPQDVHHHICRVGVRRHTRCHHCGVRFKVQDQQDNFETLQ